MKDNTQKKSGSSSASPTSSPFFGDTIKSQHEEQKDAEHFFSSQDTKSTGDAHPDAIQPTLSSDSRPLTSYGARGPHVEFLQSRLNDFGADLDMDGIFGELTYSAVKNFQKQFAPPVDGIVGPITWAALDRNIAKTDDKAIGPVPEEDLTSLASDLLDTQMTLSQDHPLVAFTYGPILNDVAYRLTANSVATKSLIPIPMNVSGQQKKSLSAEALSAQLDLILKLVAIDDGTIISQFKGNSTQDQMRRKVIFLHSVYDGIKPQDLQPLTKKEALLFLERVRLMRDFYDGFLPTSAYTKGSQVNKQPLPTGPNAGRRTRLIALALSDVGKVIAHQNPRYGSKHLKHIFDTAYPTHGYKPERFEKYKIVTKPKHGGGVTQGDWIDSWCGVGAMYWLIMAGEKHAWIRGSSGLANKLKMRPFNQKPQIGDIVIATHRQHHGIITWIDPNATLPPTASAYKGGSAWNNIAIKTVESNVSGGQILHAPPKHDKLQFFDQGAFFPFK